MARIRGVEKGHEGWLLRSAHRFSRKEIGAEIEPTAIMGHNGWVLAGVGAMEMSLRRATRLPERLKTLVDLKTAMQVECEFCIDIGAEIGRRRHLSEEELSDLARYRESDAFSELEKLALDFAVAMTRTPVDVTDGLVDELRKHLDEAQIVELTATVAWENWRARFNHALGIEPHGFSEGAFCPLREVASAG